VITSHVHGQYEVTSVAPESSSGQNPVFFSKSAKNPAPLTLTAVASSIAAQCWIAHKTLKQEHTIQSHSAPPKPDAIARCLKCT